MQTEIPPLSLNREIIKSLHKFQSFDSNFQQWERRTNQNGTFSKSASISKDLKLYFHDCICIESNLSYLDNNRNQDKCVILLLTKIEWNYSDWLWVQKQRKLQIVFVTIAVCSNFGGIIRRTTAFLFSVIKLETILLSHVNLFTKLETFVQHLTVKALYLYFSECLNVGEVANYRWDLIGDWKRRNCPVRGSPRPSTWSLHTTHCTLHTTHYTLHTTHCTLHTAHCTLQWSW